MTPAVSRKAALVLAEESPEHGREFHLQATTRLSRSPLVLSEGRVELAEVDAVRDRQHRVSEARLPAARVARVVALGKSQAHAADVGRPGGRGLSMKLAYGPESSATVAIGGRSLRHQRVERGEPLDVFDHVVRPTRRRTPPGGPRSRAPTRAGEATRAGTPGARARARTRACIFAPDVSDASMTAVPSARPDMTMLRIGKLVLVERASGQNCDTTAPARDLLGERAFSAG